MKRFIQILMVLAVALGQACEGPEGKEGAPGPQGTPGATGPQGPQGPAGVSADSAQVFDVSEATFTPDSAGYYRLFFDFTAAGVEVGETDVIMVYLLAGVANNNGTPIPFWSALPQTYYVNGLPITYNFAYSTVALILTLSAQFDLAEPGKDYTAYTDDNVYRIVVIPGRRGGRTAGAPLSKAELSKYPIDLKNYNEVVKYFKINDKNVRKYNF